MKVVRFNNVKYIPAAHEEEENPEVWKKILLTHKDLISGRTQMVSWAKLPVGKTFKAHYHEDMQEVFIMIRGIAKMKVNDKLVMIKQGDAVVVEPRNTHKMENIGDEDVEYIVFGITSGVGGKTIVT